MAAGAQVGEAVRARIGVFIPCYIAAFFPEAGIATVELLQKLDCSVDYPLDQRTHRKFTSGRAGYLTWLISKNGRETDIDAYFDR